MFLKYELKQKTIGEFLKEGFDKVNKLVINVRDKYTNYLCNVDENLCKLIEVIGNYSLELQENYYEALIKKIIGQQLSLSATNTIITRVINHCTIVTPDNINSMTDTEFSGCGVSRQKCNYIRELTKKVLSGDINLEMLSSQNDDTVIKLLTQNKGIGKWTAEMFLIFSLGRENILSSRDVSIRNAIEWLYQIKNEDINWGFYYELWSPYNTIASLYLWEIVNRNYIKNFININELFNSLKE